MSRASITVQSVLGLIGALAGLAGSPTGTPGGVHADPAVSIAYRLDPAADDAPGYPMPFPDHTGKNLHKDEVTIPDDVTGRPALLHVSFDPDQRADIDSWHAHKDAIKEAIEGVRIYEIAALSTTYKAFAGIIRGKMKDVLTTDHARETCVTFYTDPESFVDKLGLGTTEVNHIVLLDAQGRIIHAEREAFAPEKLEDLKRALTQSNDAG